MKLISKKEAKGQGLRRYFTGALCQKGHLSEKYVSDGGCAECALERANRRYADNTAGILKQSRERYQSDPGKIKARVAARREAEPEKVRAEKERDYARNKARYIAKAAEWAAANPEKVREYGRNWHKNNPLKSYASVVERRAKLKNRMPMWLSDKQKFDILAIYEKARTMSEETGVKYQVDHAVPLRGKLVSGLQVPWNLQVLTAFENQSKGNRFNAG
jgi:hypothetical protein